jgi:hypothetical protein
MTSAFGPAAQAALPAPNASAKASASLCVLYIESPCVRIWVRLLVGAVFNSRLETFPSQLPEYNTHRF